MSKRISRSGQQSQNRPPASGRRPTGRLTPSDVAASIKELIDFHHHFHAVFPRRELRYWSLFYLCGQLANLKCKTIEPMVLALQGADRKTIRAVQRFISRDRWDIQTLLIQLQALVAEWFGAPDGVVIVDGSGFPKQGTYSVGVAPQYCGHLGKVANCQEGVFLVYVSSRGYAFLDTRLYLPECWFSEEYRTRWRACGIPKHVAFHTEPELALEMIGAIARRAVIPFKWVTADETYGKSPIFLDGIASLGKWCLVEVPANTRVWLRTPPVESPGCNVLGRPRTKPRVRRTAPPPQELRDLVNQLPCSDWQRHRIKEGSKGPLIAEFAFLRVTMVLEQLPGSRGWAVFRRTLGPQPEVKFYLSNAPAYCPTTELVRISGLRWPIETTLEEGKDEVGMDHYEIRSWHGWHHHIAHTFLAHLFLMRLRLRFKNSPALTTAQARQIVARALEDDIELLQNILAVVSYHQQRNHAAYCSHRKRTISRSRWGRSRTLKREVS
jgi:SRSO17 transposase